MLFKALQIDNTRQLNQFAKKTGITLKRLQYYNDAHKMPSGTDLEIILKETGLSEKKYKSEKSDFDNRADLLSQLDSAVSEERYEDAAVLRDKIKEINLSLKNTG